MERTTKTGDAAKAIGVAATTLQKWAQRGLVPFDTTAGGHRRFSVDELETWLRGDRPPPDLESLRRDRNRVIEIAERHGLADVQVIGSVARGEAGPGSDVDLLATAASGTTLLDVMAAEAELEAALGCTVQIVTTGTVHSEMRSVLADSVTL